MRSDMRRAHFDCPYGVSGNMILGALIDLGLPVDELTAALRTVLSDGWELQTHHMQRCGIGGTFVDVVTNESHHHRGLSEIRSMISAGALPDAVKEYAVRAFTLLGEAEAAVHEMDLESVHFHEVGAIDAIIDIVGSMWGLNYFGILGSEVSTSPISVGGGTVTAAHGVIPVPAPATLRLLEGVLTKSGPVQRELATPTGCAILRAICAENAAGMGQGMGCFRVGKTGYGAGSLEIPGETNYLRLIIEDDTSAMPYDVENIAKLECEIDDMTPEMLGCVAEKAMALGALDVHFVSVQMKKFRPGIRLCLLCRTSDVPAMTELVLRETTTFGVRVQDVERHILRRAMDSVETPWGTVRVKTGYWGEEAVKRMPEYEDCKRLAAENNVAIMQVYCAAQLAAQK